MAQARVKIEEEKNNAVREVKSQMADLVTLATERIIKEKISADHLLYVSMKYTKTCDVIINLLLRWKVMIDLSMDRLIERAKKQKKWKEQQLNKK